MKDKICFFILIVFSLGLSSTTKAQSDTNKINNTRLIIMIGSSASVYSATLLGLNEIWYKDYPKTSFHFFNDNKQWMQIDKAGHFFTAYYQSLIGIQGLKWADVPNKKAIIYGSLFGLIFQTPIEILDGFSTNWGASWGDIFANTMGSALAFSQFMLWDEQKVLFRLSFNPTIYAEMRPELFGNNFPSKLLKDYNGHTFWISLPVNNLYSGKKVLPDWFCLSLGYGAEEMLGGTKLNTPVQFADYNPYRQFYFSFDINPFAIKTKSKLLKYFLIATSMIKFPAPAMEINSRKEIRFHLLYF